MDKPDVDQQGVKPRSPAKAIRQDVGCPKCHTAFEDSSSLTVRCPACNTEYDLVDLASCSANVKWFGAHGTWRFTLPAAFTVFALLVLPMISLTAIVTWVPDSGGMADGLFLLPMGLALAVAAWLWWGAYKAWGGPYGLWLVILAHVWVAMVVVAILFLGLPGLVKLFGPLLEATFDAPIPPGNPIKPLSSSLPDMAWGVVMVVAAVLLSRLGGWGERQIARQWMRRILSRSEPVA